MTRKDRRPPEANPAEPEPAEARSAVRAPAVARSEAASLDRFAALLGRAPTDAEKLELVRVKEALDLDNNDALWLLIMGLDHLRGRFERSIEGQRRAVETAIESQRREFEAAVDRRLEKAQATADALVESAKTRFLEQFPAALKRAARRVAIKALGFNGPVVLSGPVAGAALALAGLGAVGAVGLGPRAGRAVGLRAGDAGGAGRGCARAATTRAAKPRGGEPVNASKPVGPVAAGPAKSGEPDALAERKPVAARIAVAFIVGVAVGASAGTVIGFWVGAKDLRESAALLERARALVREAEEAVRDSETAPRIEP